MSGYSIEHSLVFNTAKRILRFVAPDFRVIARDDIEENESRLDLTTKTLEVPEGQLFKAAGMIIFNAGLLRLRFEEDFQSVFGKIPSLIDEKRVAEIVAQEHKEADEAAYRWAVNTMLSYFPELDETSASSYVDHRLSYEDWLKYFS